MRELMTTLLLTLLVAQPLGEAHAALPEDAIVGHWWTQNRDGRVEFLKASNGTYQGVIRYGVAPRKDIHNKDPKLRDRSVIGIVLIWNLRYEDGAYIDGYVYNPEDGDTYRMKAWMKSPRSLQVRGFLGISVFGETHTWTRYR
jgi:uncharacterized protein (DUF2147 family)